MIKLELKCKFANIYTDISAYPIKCEYRSTKEYKTTIETQSVIDACTISVESPRAVVALVKHLDEKATTLET